MNDLHTPTLLPIQKSQEGEWRTHSHTVAHTKEPRGWMTYSLPHCCLYKKAKRVNDLLTPTLLPLQKSQEGEWHSFTNCCLCKRAKRVNDLTTPTPLPSQKSLEVEWITLSHTVTCTKEPRGWMTYSLPQCYLYKKNKEGEWLIHSHTVAFTKEPRGWMSYSLPHCCRYKRAKRANDLLTHTLLPIQKS